MNPIIHDELVMMKPGIEKCQTGIVGLDQITGGGLPQGRPTLVCGAAGCGKTLLAMEFVVRGIMQHREPGVFISFEETPEELIDNVRSLGFELAKLMEQKLLAIDYMRVERWEIEETGDYNLDGLFVRLSMAIDAVKARRVVLDNVESLFSSLSDTAILRAELRRLFRWLKDRGVTSIITGEKGEITLTRQGIEEYVSDCVIMLDHRVNEQLSTRRIRVVKYRGSTHGTNEYPFLITENGLSVMPITSLELNHQVASERVSSGVPALDAMLGGKGYFRGSTVLITGTAGCGKTSLAARFVEAACQRGEKCLYFAFEESESQILRNMRSIGIELEPQVRKGKLLFQASRPTRYGLEKHLVKAHQLITEFKPTIVVLDPATNLMNAGTVQDVHTMLMRLLDHLKSLRITSLLTTLTTGAHLEQTVIDISSLIDTWILLRDIEQRGERNRGLYILKSRGMAHSNQIREFRLSDHGIDIVEAYRGTTEVLTGSARQVQEAQEHQDKLARMQKQARLQAQTQVEIKSLEAQIAALQAQLAMSMQAVRQMAGVDHPLEKDASEDRKKKTRGIDPEIWTGAALNRRKATRK